LVLDLKFTTVNSILTQNITIHYNTIKFKVKNANGTAVTLQSATGKRQKTDKSCILVGNIEQDTAVLCFFAFLGKKNLVKDIWERGVARPPT